MHGYGEFSVPEASLTPSHDRTVAARPATWKRQCEIVDETLTILGK